MDARREELKEIIKWFTEKVREIYVHASVADFKFHAMKEEEEPLFDRMLAWADKWAECKRPTAYVTGYYHCAKHGEVIPRVECQECHPLPEAMRPTVTKEQIEAIGIEHGITFSDDQMKSSYCGSYIWFNKIVDDLLPLLNGKIVDDLLALLNGQEKKKWCPCWEDRGGNCWKKTGSDGKSLIDFASVDWNLCPYCGAKRPADG